MSIVHDALYMIPEGYEIAVTQDSNGEPLYFWRRSGWEVLEAADALADAVEAHETVLERWYEQRGFFPHILEALETYRKAREVKP